MLQILRQINQNRFDTKKNHLSLQLGLSEKISITSPVKTWKSDLQSWNNNTPFLTVHIKIHFTGVYLWGVSHTEHASSLERLYIAGILFWQFSALLHSSSAAGPGIQPPTHPNYWQQISISIFSITRQLQLSFLQTTGACKTYTT